MSNSTETPRTKQCARDADCIHPAGPFVELPMTEFYKTAKAYCKYCHRAASNQKKWERSTAGDPIETEVVNLLRSEGIYATLGKASEFTNVDVVSWGCVRIEVKSAEQRANGKWYFNFQNQRGKGIKADLVLLVLIDGKDKTYHLFPATHPIFYRKGKLKGSVQYDPSNTANRDYGSSLTEARMWMYQNAWHLIEEHRQRIINQLSEGKRFQPGRVQEPAPPMRKLL